MCRFLHHEAADPPVARLRVRIRLCEDGDGVSVFAVRDEHLAPVQDVLLPVPLRRRLDVLHVAARLRLSQAERAANVAARHRGQQAFLLLVGAKVAHYRGHDVVRPDDSRNAHPALTELLEDHRHRRLVKTEAAVLFRYGDAEEPQFTHSRNEFLRVLVLIVVT